jgi:hypothetical protein
MIRLMSVGVLTLSLMAFGCGGDEKKTGASGTDEASQGSQSSLEAKEANLRTLQEAIMKKSATGQMPTPEEIERVSRLTQEIMEIKHPKAVAKPAGEAVPAAAVRAGANAIEEAKEAYRRNAPALKAIGGAAMDKMVDGGTQALDAIGKNGRINMKSYKAGVGKQLDALESMGGDSKAIRGARDAMKNMPSMPSMPKMPSMPSGF